MIIAETGLEQVLKTLGKLRPEELEVVEKQLTYEKHKPKISPLPKTLLEDERFLISFDDYLALSDEEGEELKLMAYEKYGDWIYRELAERRAKWMLICKGEIVEWSPTLDDYPSREKRHAIGRQMGYAPWTFIANPVIEESYWAAVADNDFYPSLSIALGAANWNEEDVIKKGLKFDADFDTGSGNIMLDYTLMRSRNIIENQYGKETESGKHLGRPFQCYVLPIQVAITDETEKVVSKLMSAISIRNWQQSPLCLVNPVRKALVGRNLLYELPLRVELDGGNRTTKILSQSQ
jgi:hypothetical protein